MTRDAPAVPTSQAQAEQEMRRRDAARGCLLALVFELAALLAAGLWVFGWWIESPEVQRAGVFGFIAFTVCTAGALVLTAVLARRKNPPWQRQHQPADEHVP